MRGEKFATEIKGEEDVGSSPLARGKEVECLPVLIHRRIIPACAGKRGRMPSCADPSEDHPRLRGEKTYSGLASINGRGSSPLARGKVFAASTAIFAWGIIPACAGKSNAATWPGSPFRDHPRLRGEKFALASGFLRFSGSSPLARGKDHALP